MSFILDYNRFSNDYTIYSFSMSIEIREMIKANKYINITGQGIDDGDSKAILICETNV